MIHTYGCITYITWTSNDVLLFFLHITTHYTALDCTGASIVLKTLQEILSLGMKHSLPTLFYSALICVLSDSESS